MKITPTIDYFDAYTVELYPDVRDRVAHTVIDIRSGEGAVLQLR